MAQFIQTPEGRYIPVNLGRGYGVYSFWGKNFPPFVEMRKFARSLGLKSKKEWIEYYRREDKNIPYNPGDIYKDKGWISWGDFLGTGHSVKTKRSFLSLEETREFMKKNNIKSKEWERLRKVGQRPSNIPHNLYEYYQDKGWVSFSHIFGSENNYNRRPYLSFEEARKFVRQLGLKSAKEWNDYCKSGKKHNNIPYNVSQEYKNKGWESMGDFLGNGRFHPLKGELLPFLEARDFARNLKLKVKGLNKCKVWEKYCKSGSKPNNIPCSPSEVYKDKGWKGIRDWFGVDK